MSNSVDHEIHSRQRVGDGLRELMSYLNLAQERAQQMMGDDLHDGLRPEVQDILVSMQQTEQRIEGFLTKLKSPQ